MLFILRSILRLPLPKNIQELITWPVASRILGLDFTKVVTLRCGKRVSVGMGDVLQRNILFYGQRINDVWEPMTTRLLELLAKDADHTLLAGAHVGYMAARVAHGSEGMIHAFEPSKVLFTHAKETFRHLPCGRLTYAALGSYDGKVCFSGDDLRAHVSDKGVTVPIMKAVTYAKKMSVSHFDIALLDVEGAELEALKGFDALPKDMIIEVSSKTSSLEKAEATRSFLKKNNFDLYVVIDRYLDDIPKEMSGKSVRVAPLSDNVWKKALLLRYVNLLATKRSASELEVLGIKVSVPENLYE